MKKDNSKGVVVGVEKSIHLKMEKIQAISKELKLPKPSKGAMIYRQFMGTETIDAKLAQLQKLQTDRNKLK